MYVMGRKLPTSADDMKTTATEIELLIFTKRNFTLALFSALTVEMIMAIHISDSDIFYITIFHAARLSNSTVLLETVLVTRRAIR